MSLTKYDCHKKNQKVLSKKQSYGHENKKTLESELNRICEDKKRQKEYKKQLFNQNIKSHIVYMDENGTIQENLGLSSKVCKFYKISLPAVFKAAGFTCRINTAHI